LSWNLVVCSNESPTSCQSFPISTSEIALAHALRFDFQLAPRSHLWVSLPSFHHSHPSYRLICTADLMNLVLNLIELASWKTRKNDTWLSCVITSQAGTSFVQSSHLSVQAKEANLLPDLRNRNPKGKAHYQVHVMEVRAHPFLSVCLPSESRSHTMLRWERSSDVPTGTPMVAKGSTSPSKVRLSLSPPAASFPLLFSRKPR
jgi:hypothetical protein